MHEHSKYVRSLEGSLTVRNPSRFATYAWAVVAYNLLVILWGGFVRATGSGAGCGAHWPVCNGQIIPRAAPIETLIEYSHRLSSGLALISVLVLVIWAFRAFPRGHAVRKGAVLSGLFMISEALVGAGLVLLELVAYNVSIARAWWMAGHLLNTFLLMGSLALTAWWASGHATARMRGQGGLVWLLGLALFGMMVLGASGAVTALGDQLALGGGISPEESPVVASLVSLRIFHPMIAIGVGALVMAAAWMARLRRPGVTTRQLSSAILLVYLLQLLVGALNVALKAPVWIQLVHLLLTNVIWLLLVLISAQALSQPFTQRADSAPSALPNPTA